MVHKDPDPWRKTKVWDIGTRLFHWLLAISFGLSVYSAFQDKFGIYADMHLYAGLAILVLVVWRIVWGFVGSETSRFSQFVKSPQHTLRYLTASTTPPIGHNPLGGYSVLLMLLLLLAQASLGLFASDDMLFSGPLSAHAGAAAGDIRDIHALLGRILMAVVALHLTAVFWYSIRHKAKLIWPMLTGFKTLDENEKSPAIKSPWLAAGVLLIVLATLYGLVL